MNKQTAVDNKMPQHIKDKRDELIWSLAIQQEYSPVDIQKMFNFKHISTVTRIITRKPTWWRSPWIKRGQTEA